MLFLSRFETPLGIVTAGADDEGVCLLDFADGGRAEVLVRRLHISVHAGINPHLVALQRELSEWFAGQRRGFTVPLHPVGTSFQMQAWAALREIPFGATHSYGKQARAMGCPRSVRAVGGANGANPVPILIPCHRVIAGDGSLGGYSGGLWRKRWLLDFEAG